MTDMIHRDDSIVAHQPQTFTREQVELVKRTVAKGTSNDELSLFLEVARRRQLDPFSGQIHAVMRWDSRENRKTMTIQVGLHGQRAIASRTGLHEYTEGPEFTADGETWTDTWIADAPPKAARCRVKRRDQSKPHQRPVLWDEYAQTDKNGDLTHMWANLGITMLGKVAEVHALRAAFPDELGAFYAPEEMDQATTPPADTNDSEGDEPEVDHADVRRDLHRTFMGWWNSLDDDTQQQVWAESLRGRFWGDGGWGDWFASTPLHILQDIVDTLVGVDPEVVAEGNDQDPEDVCANCGKVDDHDTDDCTSPSVGEYEAELAPEALEDGYDDPTPDEPMDDDHPGGMTKVEALETYYPHLTVADVGTLLRTGQVTIDTGPRSEATLILPDGGLDLVERLETEHHDPFRKTVAGALDSARENTPQSDDTGPPADEDADAGTDGSDGGQTPENATQRLERLLDQAGDVVERLNQPDAKRFRTRLAELIAESDDGVPDAEQLAGMIRHAERLAAENGDES